MKNDSGTNIVYIGSESNSNVSFIRNDSNVMTISNTNITSIIPVVAPSFSGSGAGLTNIPISAIATQIPYSKLDISKSDITSLGIPAFDTNLTESQVVAYVENNGYINSESQVDAMVANNGYLTSYTDTNTQLTESQVDAMVANNGYQTSAQVESAITSRGYLTSSPIKAFGEISKYGAVSGGSNLTLLSHSCERVDGLNGHGIAPSYTLFITNTFTFPSALADNNYVVMTNLGNESVTKFTDRVTLIYRSLNSLHTNSCTNGYSNGQIISGYVVILSM